MSIKHHLTEPLLMAYSAGTLPEAFSLVVATHVSMCDECRAQLASFDAVGGGVLETCETEVLGDDAFAVTMAMIENMGDDAIVTQLDDDALFPAPLQDYVGGDLDAVRWKKTGGGVSQAILRTSDDASVRLIRIPAGASVPDHGHRGTELTLVLQGAFRDEEDRFAPGDVEVANEDLHHTPVAEDGADCICLAATDAPLKFSGLLPRIAQPFLRI